MTAVGLIATVGVLLVSWCDTRVMDDQETANVDILERDGYACVRCEARLDPDGTAERHVVTVASPAVETPGADEPLQMVQASVCQPCRDRLRGEDPPWLDDQQDLADCLLAFLRDLTTAQGGTVAAVAAFATDATTGIESDDRQTYLAMRRRVHVSLTYVERTLDAAELELATLGEAVTDEFEAVCALATDLHAELVAVTELTETVVASAGACHACLEPCEDTASCGRCGAPVHETASWQTEDGISMGALYGSVNDRLDTASATTGELTERTTALASALVGD